VNAQGVRREDSRPPLSSIRKTNKQKGSLLNIDDDSVLHSYPHTHTHASVSACRCDRSSRKRCELVVKELPATEWWDNSCLFFSVYLYTRVCVCVCVCDKYLWTTNNPKIKKVRRRQMQKCILIDNATGKGKTQGKRCLGNIPYVYILNTHTKKQITHTHREK
jgi:hypothetical protein